MAGGTWGVGPSVVRGGWVRVVHGPGQWKRQAGGARPQAEEVQQEDLQVQWQGFYVYKHSGAALSFCFLFEFDARSV